MNKEELLKLSEGKLKEDKLQLLPNGKFKYNSNIDLTSMELSSLPIWLSEIEEVRGGFYCDYNSLTSLEHCPSKIGGNFYCYDNSLTSLEHMPKEIGGNFNCASNKLPKNNFKGMSFKEIRAYYNLKSNLAYFESL